MAALHGCKWDDISGLFAPPTASQLIHYVFINLDTNGGNADTLSCWDKEIIGFDVWEVARVLSRYGTLGRCRWVFDRYTRSIYCDAAYVGGEGMDCSWRRGSLGLGFHGGVHE